MDEHATRIIHTQWADKIVYAADTAFDRQQRTRSVMIGNSAILIGLFECLRRSNDRTVVVRSVWHSWLNFLWLLLVFCISLYLLYFFWLCAKSEWSKEYIHSMLRIPADIKLLVVVIHDRTEEVEKTNKPTPKSLFTTVYVWVWVCVCLSSFHDHRWWIENKSDKYTHCCGVCVCFHFSCTFAHSHSPPSPLFLACLSHVACPRLCLSLSIDQFGPITLLYLLFCWPLHKLCGTRNGAMSIWILCVHKLYYWSNRALYICARTLPTVVHALGINMG